MMKPLAFTFRQLLLLFICQAVSYPFVSMGIASFVGFPIPFFALSTFPVFFTLLLAWFTAIVGRKTAKDMLKRSDQVNIHVRFMCAQMLLPVVYPIYEVLFVAASNTHFELPVILLLPILKVLMKYLITLSLAPMEDMLPESVILTVDFFHAVYLATCMQSSRSLTTMSIIIIVDVSQSLSMLSGLYRRSRTTLARAHRAAGISTDKTSLASLLCLICSSSEKMDKQNLNGIRIRSCLLHTLSPANQHILHRLESLRKRRSAARSSSRGSSSAYLLRIIPTKKPACGSQICARMCWWQRRNMIQPFPSARTSVFPASTTEDPSGDRRSSRRSSLMYRRSNILREGLEALFTSECLVLASYLHTSIALFYASFVEVMVYLPSARYHTELRDVTPDNVQDTVKFVFVFGALEFVSFALLAVMIYEKYGMQALYHLAFVLETQVALVQGKVMMWMLIILAFRVVHFGVDFTLKFAWMKDVE
ncbi:hypothetical protein PF011_g7204 [Phytophthora fragariae]|nr:hypothetical protein PF011_g7204 [Phytophthora fragariae]